MVVLVTACGTAQKTDGKDGTGSSKQKPQTQEKAEALVPEQAAGETGEPEKAVSPEGKKIPLALYFATSDNSAVKAEKREVLVKDGAIMRAAVEALINGPQSEELHQTIPEGTRLLGIKRDGDTAVVDFSKEFDMANDVAGVVARVSLVNTLTEITGIEKVKILVQGKDLIGPSGMPLGAMAKAALDADGKPLPGDGE